MYNYKGIFYKEEKDKKYYEGGAHFSYSELVYELNKLIKERNKNIELNLSKDSKDNILLSTNQNILKDVQNSKSLINKQNKMKLYFLTINNNSNKNKIHLSKDNKLILNTEKNNENRNNSLNNNLMSLEPKNMKITSPKATLFSNNKNFLSVENNYNNIKTLGNNVNRKDIYKNISLYINHNKEMKNKNLPLIKDFHYINFSNKNILKKKQNNIFTIKLKSKIEASKHNLFLKNKALSPLKNIQSNRENKILSLDFSDSKYNKNSIDAVTYNKNKIYLNKGRMNKYFKDDINKRKNKAYINIINLIKNK